MVAIISSFFIYFLSFVFEFHSLFPNFLRGVQKGIQMNPPTKRIIS